MIKPLIVFGTRPELIKLYPVVCAFCEKGINPVVVFTGQHTSLVEETMRELRLENVIKLSLMLPNQTPESFFSRCMQTLERLVDSNRVDALLVQGDTTTSLVGALVGFYKKIPVAHVEAGLRTRNLHSPFPEEGHRQLISRVSSWNFCPTLREVHALEEEGIAKQTIFNVGNTVIDTLRLTCDRLGIEVPPASDCSQVLVTIHRRESFGGGLATIAQAIATLAEQKPKLDFILPLHPNPAVANEIRNVLEGRSNVQIIQPLPYATFIRELCSSRFVISDSGGIQEEAPWLGRPVIVVREVTERPQAIDAGASFLCGSSDSDCIVDTALLLTEDTSVFRASAVRRSLFGNGFAAQEIVRILNNTLVEVV